MKKTNFSKSQFKKKEFLSELESILPNYRVFILLINFIYCIPCHFQLKIIHFLSFLLHFYNVLRILYRVIPLCIYLFEFNHYLFLYYVIIKFVFRF